MAADFELRYLGTTDDAWGYSNSDLHQLRHSMILDAIPNRPFTSGLEAGCAEGHLTRHLARRVDRLLACDISELAIERARRRNADVENVEFVTADIRDGLMLKSPDLIVFSDVLYYLAPKEISKVIKECASTIKRDGILLFANEWASHYRKLTSPDETLELINATGEWNQLSNTKTDTSAASTLTVTSFVRNVDPDTHSPS